MIGEKFRHKHNKKMNSYYLEDLKNLIMKSKKIKLSITGCMGRMGQQLIKASRKNKNFKLHSLTEYKPINKKIGIIKPQLNCLDAFKKTDIIIDFTVPKCTLRYLKLHQD